MKEIDGQEVVIKRPSDAIKANIAYIPEDRKRQGLVLKRPIRFNSSLVMIDKFKKAGLVEKASEKAAVQKLIDALKIKLASMENWMTSLSGGNQQKVVISKWLMEEKIDVLIMDEPTRGIDVGAKYEIYKLMNDLANEGLGIILVTSDLPELLNLSDRVMVIKNGKSSGLLEKVSSGVNEKVSEKETLGIKFFLNNDVQNLLIGGREDSETIFQVTRLLFSNEYTDVNDVIFLCGKDGKLYTNSMISKKEARRLLTDGKKQLTATGQTYQWLESEEVNEVKIIPYIREIDDLYGVEDLDKGYFVTGLQEQLLQDIYDSYFGDDKGSIYVISSDKQILSSNNQELIGKDFFQIYIPDKKQSEDSSYYEVRIHNDIYYLITLIDEKCDWEYIYLLKRDVALSGMESIRMVPVGGMFIAFIISIIMSIIASWQIVQPIKELTNAIQEVEKGDMTIRFKVPEIKEIAELGEFFNKMMQKVEDSIQQIYVVQKQRRDAEMKALVLQINPHFLYNTLSSIIWLSNADKKDEVIEMTSSLATLFRISISKGQEIVTIREEFEHVKSYIRIQQIRFENKFNCYVELDEDIADCYTIKVILQPLVENIINHALCDSIIW